VGNEKAELGISVDAEPVAFVSLELGSGCLSSVNVVPVGFTSVDDSFVTSSCV